MRYNIFRTEAPPNKLVCIRPPVSQKSDDITILSHSWPRLFYSHNSSLKLNVQHRVQTIILATSHKGFITPLCK